MALYKEIRQEDGVTTKYHRILFIQKTINRQNSIVVVSYVDDKSRSDELQMTTFQPYQKSTTYELDYDPNMTVEMAYAYLARLPVFEGATEV